MLLRDIFLVVSAVQSSIAGHLSVSADQFIIIKYLKFLLLRDTSKFLYLLFFYSRFITAMFHHVSLISSQKNIESIFSNF